MANSRLARSILSSVDRIAEAVANDVDVSVADIAEIVTRMDVAMSRLRLVLQRGGRRVGDPIVSSTPDEVA
ncbi:hypothetical protein [Salinarimonas soli]|uniref:Uncharacterized protein n=1 Tax=Salinarimonas soli TaxID=1638099 RepID=A0A5B2VR62_9HYPH|nr:hypothetical protein [Salinarimonas soli]KAA2241158.1 hypothetical protein F0L46_05000 [Salinarimonas soli]